MGFCFDILEYIGENMPRDSYFFNRHLETFPFLKHACNSRFTKDIPVVSLIVHHELVMPTFSGCSRTLCGLCLNISELGIFRNVFSLLREHRILSLSKLVYISAEVLGLTYNLITILSSSVSIPNIKASLQFNRKKNPVMATEVVDIANYLFLTCVSLSLKARKNIQDTYGWGL